MKHCIVFLQAEESDRPLVCLSYVVLLPPFRSERLWSNTASNILQFASEGIELRLLDWFWVSSWNFLGIVEGYICSPSTMSLSVVNLTFRPSCCSLLKMGHNSFFRSPFSLVNCSQTPNPDSFSFAAATFNITLRSLRWLIDWLVFDTNYGRKYIDLKDAK